jgi:hypothetical protein
MNAWQMLDAVQAYRSAMNRSVVRGATTDAINHRILTAETALIAWFIS